MELEEVLIALLEDGDGERDFVRSSLAPAVIDFLACFTTLLGLSASSASRVCTGTAPIAIAMRAKLTDRSGSGWQVIAAFL